MGVHVSGACASASKDVLEMLASGATELEILESYPYLEREDIQASLEYAARQVDHAVFSLAK